jgi:thioredoxin-dependent peroxiredoxin
MKAGDLVPDVALPDQSGTVRHLSELAGGRRTVLFFYPAAMTTGCTKEGCRFRDLATEFEALDAVRVGISMDPVEKQAAFAAKHDFDYPLLSDPDGTVARQFGVKRPLDVLRTKRVTFVLDEDRRVLEVVRSEFNMDAHADTALKVLAAAPRHAGGAAPTDEPPPG